MIENIYGKGFAERQNLFLWQFMPPDGEAKLKK